MSPHEAKNGAGPHPTDTRYNLEQTINPSVLPTAPGAARTLWDGVGGSPIAEQQGGWGSPGESTPPTAENFAKGGSQRGMYHGHWTGNGE